MPYRRRIHVPGGTYYVVQRGSKLHPIFAHHDEYAFFENVLRGALRNTDARLHAYCWTTVAIYLAVQLDGVSVGHFMQLLKSRYARGAQKRRGEHGYFFQGRYDAVVIDPNDYLLSLIHHIHYIPVLVGSAKRPDDYSHSSHQAYTHALTIPWLHTDTVLQLLANTGEQGQQYRELMSAPPMPRMAKLFERGAPDTPGILGGPEFLQAVNRPWPRTSRMTLDQVIQQVCGSLRVSQDDVQSRSRLRKLALARAVIAWQATARGVATIAEISRYLGRASSTLSQGISLYRERRPELFKLDVCGERAMDASQNRPVGTEDDRSGKESVVCRSRANGGTSK